MELIDIAVERTTAATDLLLAVVAAAMVAWLLRMEGDPFKRRLWAAILGLLGLGAALGAVAHGFRLAPPVEDLLWQPLYLSLGWSVGLFVVAVVLDLFGRRWALWALPLMLLLGLGFYLTTRRLGGEFRLFILYEATALGIALLAYSGLLLGGRLPGVRWLVLGIATLLAASMVQASQAVRVTWIWDFDHNGVFHLLLIPAVIFLAVGVRGSLRAAD